MLILSITFFAHVLASSAVPAVHAETDPCLLSSALVSASGPLPWAGDVEGQRNFLSRRLKEEPRKFTVRRMTIQGEPAYRFRMTNADGSLTENILYNHLENSYQITLSSPKQFYRKTAQLLPVLLRSPWQRNIRCPADAPRIDQDR